MSEKSEGALSAKQIDIVFKAFHGSDAYASYSEQFMKGSGVFESAFDRKPIENNRDGNDDRSSGGTGTAEMLELKELLHCRPGECLFLFCAIIYNRAPNS